MIEQNKLNNPLYYTDVIDNSLINKQITVAEVKFGPFTSIHLYRRKETDQFLVHDLESNTAYIYKGSKFIKTTNEISTKKSDIKYEYYAGIADINGRKSQYLIKNKPRVKIKDKLDFTKFEIPTTFTGHPYEQTFSLLPELVDLLKYTKATFVDKFKRPLNPTAFMNGSYYPIGIDSVETTLKDIVPHLSNFPIVIQLKNTKFGMFDLEPGYTDEEYNLVQSLDILYEEETPRGGKHYLIRTDSNVFKYRVSTNLEVITNTMITLYGINGKIRNLDAKPVDLSNYTPVGHQSISIDTTPQDVVDIVDELLSTNKNTVGIQMAKAQYQFDEDLSHADFVSMLNIYRHDIKPIVHKFKEEQIPWILAEYTARNIPYRLKHDENRQGVPFLVFLANKIIHQR